MAIDPKFHHRGSIRLREYDYSQPGGYFVTLCTHRRECILGDIADGNVQLNQFGEIVKEEWLRTEQIRPEITMDEFMVMPNHMHGIIMIRNDIPNISVGAHGGASLWGRRTPKDRAHINSPLRREPKTLGSIIAGFKSVVTHRINLLRKTPLTPIWQRNYYEHIIRDEENLNRIRQYIIDNPVKWDEDEENPQNWKK
jgi:REP element-mobilizing transposase RayT